MSWLGTRLTTRHLGGLPALDRPLVMGVVNVTPDSFSDGGRWFDPEAAIEHGLELLEDGADLLDIGGESTRPGATRPVVAEALLEHEVLDAEQLKALVEGRPIAVRVRTPATPPPPPREGKIEHEGGRAGGILPPPMPAPKPS